MNARSVLLNPSPTVAVMEDVPGGYAAGVRLSSQPLASILLSRNSQVCVRTRLLALRWDTIAELSPHSGATASGAVDGAVAAAGACFIRPTVIGRFEVIPKGAFSEPEEAQFTELLTLCASGTSTKGRSAFIID